MSFGRLVQRNVDLGLGIEPGQEEVFETGGAVFPDGQCIELIRTKDGVLKLLRSTRKRGTTSVKKAGWTFVPPTLHPSIMEALQLPTTRVPCGTTVDLFGRILNVFGDYGVSDEAARLIAFFSIATWFTDLLPAAPCLLLVGPRPEANMVLQLLACVVRHALPLGDVSLAAFRSLPMHLQPTMLIGHLPPSMYKILPASIFPRAYLPCKDGLTDPCSSKAIYAGARLANIFHGDSILTINLVPSHGKLPVVDPRGRQVVALDLQPRLLDYKLKYVPNVLASDFDVPKFSSSLRILARSLGACIVDAPDLQARIVPLLEGQQELLRANRWSNPECITLEVLLGRCHSAPGSSRLGIGEIAEAATSTLAERGGRKLEPKVIGNFLRDLGLVPRRDNQGYAVFLTDDVRRQIHKLARDHEVEDIGQAETACVQCAELVGVSGDSGVTPI